MLTRLNLETRSLHPEADALWVDLLSCRPTIQKYVDTLVIAYGFDAPIEAALWLTPGVNAAVPLRPRARIGFLVQDLLALGFTASRIARLPQCLRIEPFRGVPDALGWLYVAERSTLLQETVRRHLEAALPTVRAFSYLSAYQGHTGLRWQELGHALDDAAHDRDIGDQIVAAARDAFATLRDWTQAGTQADAQPEARQSG